MRKVLLVCFMVLLLTGGLFANDARLLGLGSPRPYVKDYYDMFYNPAVVAAYSDLAYVEFGTPGGMSQYGGVNYEVIENLVIGVAVNRKYGEIFDMLDIAGASGIPTPLNGLDIMGAYNLGNVKLGMGFYTIGAKATSKVGDDESTAKAGNTGINFGACLNMGETVVSAAANIRMNKFKTEDASDNVHESTGGMGMGFSGRAFIPITSKLKAVPALWFRNHSFGEEYSNGTSSEIGDYSTMVLGVGIGGNYELDNTLLVMSASFIMDNCTNERTEGVKVTESDMYFPALNLGVEHNFWKGVTGRFGLRKNIGSNKVKTEPDEGDESESTSTLGTSTVASVGLGFVFGNFSLDWFMSSSILFNGPYLFTGSASAFSSNVTATYDW
ncbi:hypothetical protein JXI42_05750 [bacterium]|nr:hypothetical protein [bacterium]